MSEWSGVERIVQKRLTLIPLAIIYNLNAHTRTRRMNGLFICFGIVCVRHRPVYLFVDLYILCVCVYVFCCLHININNGTAHSFGKFIFETLSKETWAF